LFAFKITGHYRIRRIEAGGAVNGRQPSRSDTDRTSAAVASRR
jgi:hypothetical protein